jgi:hypothetical protein
MLVGVWLPGVGVDREDATGVVWTGLMGLCTRTAAAVEGVATQALWGELTGEVWAADTLPPAVVGVVLVGVSVWETDAHDEIGTLDECTIGGGEGDEVTLRVGRTGLGVRIVGGEASELVPLVVSSDILGGRLSVAPAGTGVWFPDAPGVVQLCPGLGV